MSVVSYEMYIITDTKEEKIQNLIPKGSIDTIIVIDPLSGEELLELKEVKEDRYEDIIYSNTIPENALEKIRNLVPGNKIFITKIGVLGGIYQMRRFTSITINITE